MWGVITGSAGKAFEPTHFSHRSLFGSEGLEKPIFPFEHWPLNWRVFVQKPGLGDISSYSSTSLVSADEPHPLQVTVVLNWHLQCSAKKRMGSPKWAFAKRIWWAAQNVISVRLTDSCLWMAFCLAWHPGMPPSTKARRREVWAFRCGFVAVLTACRVLSDKVRRIVATRGARILTWRGGVAYICRICSQECKGPWLDPEPMKTQRHSQKDQTWWRPIAFTSWAGRGSLHSHSRWVGAECAAFLAWSDCGR